MDTNGESKIGQPMQKKEGRVVTSALHKGRTIICLAPRKNDRIKGVLEERDGILFLVKGSLLCPAHQSRLPDSNQTTVNEWINSKHVRLKPTSGLLKVVKDVEISSVRLACNIIEGNTNGNPYRTCCVAAWEGKMKDDISGKITTVTLDALEDDTADKLADTLRRAFNKPNYIRPIRVELRSAKRIALLGDSMALTHLLGKLDLMKDQEEPYVVGFEDTRSLIDRLKSLSIWGCSGDIRSIDQKEKEQNVPLTEGDD